METDRIGFSRWQRGDIALAKSLWGSGAVTRYIGAPEGFSDDAVFYRLGLECRNGEKLGLQYWTLFERTTGELVGCCGFRPSPEGRALDYKKASRMGGFFTKHC